MNAKSIIALVVLAVPHLSANAGAQTPARSPASAPQAVSPSPPPAPARPAPAPSSAAAELTIKATEVIARVGSIDVTAEEVKGVIATLDARQQSALARDPASLSQTVRAILANRLVLKEALAKKWEQQPNVAVLLERTRDNLIVESYLQSVTNPPDTFPNETEIKAVYERNASAFLVPRRFQLAQIFVAVAKEADKASEEKARKKLDDVVKKLKQPRAEFAAIAKGESDDTESAERGGEIGWLAEAEMRPEIRSHVAGLAQGAITDPLRLDDGWHILKLLDTQASHTRPLAEVRDALAQRMRAERADANRRAYMAELLKQNPPAINELALTKLLEATPSTASR
jgi:peptidylprolyl isomerase